LIPCAGWRPAAYDSLCSPRHRSRRRFLQVPSI